MLLRLVLPNSHNTEAKWKVIYGKYRVYYRLCPLSINLLISRGSIESIIDYVLFQLIY
jgi:hypothetical protein